MRKNAPALIVSAVSATVVALAAGIWGLMQEAPAPSRRLPDGSRVRLAEVSFGKEHFVFQEALWQALLRPMLPWKLRGREVDGLITGKDALVFLLSKVGLPARDPVCWQGIISARKPAGLPIVSGAGSTPHPLPRSGTGIRKR